RLEEAMDMVNTGIAQVPDYADLYYYGGLISYDTKNYGAAYAFFERCLSLPEQPVHYASHCGMRGFRPCFYLGQLAEKFCNEEEALRYYIQGLRDNPLFFPILANITRILRPREDPAYARSALERLCNFCSPQAYLIMGQIFFREGAFDLALEYLRRGAAGDGEQEPSLNTIHQAVCLLQQAIYPEAVELLNLFLPKEPLYPLAIMNKLLCFWFQGNNEQVRKAADQLFALGLTPDTGAVVGLLRDISEGKEAFTVRLEEEGMTLLLEILMRTLALKRWDYGEKLLQRLNENCLTEYGLKIGDILKKYGRLEESRNFVRMYLDSHPDSAEAYGMMAELLRDTGAFFEAASYYRQAIDKNPREPQYYCKLIALYKDLGRAVLDKAAERFSPITSLVLSGEEAGKP
ncbi:MAG: tetratricopeptide repeat protein, partial [Veillonellales bacterium]